MVESVPCVLRRAYRDTTVESNGPGGKQQGELHTLAFRSRHVDQQDVYRGNVRANSSPFGARMPLHALQFELAAIAHAQRMAPSARGHSYAGGTPSCETPSALCAGAGLLLDAVTGGVGRAAAPLARTLSIAWKWARPLPPGAAAAGTAPPDVGASAGGAAGCCAAGCCAAAGAAITDRQ